MIFEHVLTLSIPYERIDKPQTQDRHYHEHCSQAKAEPAAAGLEWLFHDFSLAEKLGNLSKVRIRETFPLAIETAPQNGTSLYFTSVCRMARPSLKAISLESAAPSTMMVSWACVSQGSDTALGSANEKFTHRWLKNLAVRNSLAV
jgi:hypothetical protein